MNPLAVILWLVAGLGGLVSLFLAQPTVAIALFLVHLLCGLAGYLTLTGKKPVRRRHRLSRQPAPDVWRRLTSNELERQVQSRLAGLAGNVELIEKHGPSSEPAAALFGQLKNEFRRLHQAVIRIRAALSDSEPEFSKPIFKVTADKLEETHHEH